MPKLDGVNPLWTNTKPRSQALTLSYGDFTFSGKRNDCGFQRWIEETVASTEMP